jgi:hypothetical protein
MKEYAVELAKKAGAILIQDLISFPYSRIYVESQEIRPNS